MGNRRVTERELQERRADSEALRSYLKANNVGISEAARALGISQGALHQRLRDPYMAPTTEMWDGLRKYVAERAEGKADYRLRSSNNDETPEALRARREETKRLLHANGLTIAAAAAFLGVTSSSLRNTLGDERMAPSEEVIGRLKDWIAAGAATRAQDQAEAGADAWWEETRRVKAELRALLKISGLTRSAFSDMVGVAYCTVWAWTKEHRRLRPNPKAMQTLRQYVANLKGAAA